MQTIRLRINDKIYKNILWLLGRFDKEELQVIEEDEQFVSAKSYLIKELERLNNEEVELFEIDDIDRKLEDTIKEYEA